MVVCVALLVVSVVVWSVVVVEAASGSLFGDVWEMKKRGLPLKEFFGEEYKEGMDWTSLPGMEECTIERVPDLSREQFLREYNFKKPVIFGQPFDDESRVTTEEEKKCREFATKESLMAYGPVPITMYSVSGYAQTRAKSWVLDAFLKSLDTQEADYTDSTEHMFHLFGHGLAQWEQLTEACGQDENVKVTIEGDEDN
eukprot:m.61091 g.61091  ORF g.61091 m.61091 type:complete len:198 (-) comp11377_c0_seq1:1932-2525(-)